MSDKREDYVVDVISGLSGEVRRLPLAVVLVPHPPVFRKMAGKKLCCPRLFVRVQYGLG